MAELAGAQGQHDQATRLLGAAAALRDELDTPLPPVERGAYERLLAATREALGDECFSTTWAAEQSLTVEGLLAEALTAAGA